MEVQLPIVWPPFSGEFLRRGSRGASVTQIQQRLNELGITPPLATDGVFGPLTEAAVIEFQTASGLVPDGIVGPLTWNALFIRYVWPPYPGVVLRRGLRGPSVRQVQERLNELGANPPLATDGIFGPLTEAAVMAFQRERGLQVNGLVGPLTWNALFSRMIALTFDDGPGPFTEQLLDILERNNARATFFVLGELVEGRRNTVARAANLGNEVASHTWSHVDLRQLSDLEVAASIRATNAVIQTVTGFAPPFYRPPYGFTNEEVRRVSGELGYSIVLWTLDTLDWQYRDADIIYNTIMNNVRDGDIILLHDVHATTVDAMERVIPALIAEGYQLVTVSELLASKYGQLEPGQIYGSSRPIVIQD